MWGDKIKEILFFIRSKGTFQIDNFVIMVLVRLFYIVKNANSLIYNKKTVKPWSKVDIYTW